MNSIKISFLLLFGLISGVSVAQAKFHLDKQDTELMVMGTSSTHDWQMSSQEALGELSAKIVGGKVQSVSKLSVSLPAKSVKSGKELMEEKAHAALGADKNPNITFTLKKAEKKAEKWLLMGDFSLAGVTKPITLQVELLPTAKGVEVKGSYSFLLSDFGVKAPTVLVFKVKDEVTIWIKAHFKY